MELLLAAVSFAFLSGVIFYFLYRVLSKFGRKRQFEERLAAFREAELSASSGVEEQIVREQFHDRLPLLLRGLAEHFGGRRLIRWVNQAGVSVSVWTVLLIAGLLGCSTLLILVALGFPVLLVMPLVLLGGLSPFAVIAVLRHRRFAKFEEQFPDALEFLSRAVRAGHAVTTVLEMIGNELSDPVAKEFKTLYRQQNLGLPLSACLNNLANRVPLSEVKIFVAALQIQRESGGNLAEILDKLSYVIRERAKLARQVRIHTAEARISLYILTAAPPLAAFMLQLLNPNYLEPLINDPMGQRMLVGGLVLVVIGYTIIKRITQIRV